MKTIKIAAVLLLLIISAGCSEDTEKRLVKLVTVDKEYVSVYYYDYSSEKPSYHVEKAENRGVKNTFTEILSQNIYDLKLCRYVVCSREITETDTANIFCALTQSKFSPDIAIVQGETDRWKEYIQLDTSRYPIYCFKTNDKGLSGIVENAEDKSKNIIYENLLYRRLDRQKSCAADIICKKTKDLTYIFEKENKKYSAQLKNIAVYYSFGDDEVRVDITATLKSYMGMSAGEQNREEFILYLTDSLKNDIQSLYSDRITADCLSLLWYKQVLDSDNLSVNLNIR